MKIAKEIKMLVKDNQSYLEFGYDEEDEILLLEFDLVGEEVDKDVL